MHSQAGLLRQPRFSAPDPRCGGVKYGKPQDLVFSIFFQVKIWIICELFRISHFLSEHD